MKGSLGINISYVFFQIRLDYPFFMILCVIKIYNKLLQRNGAWLPFQNYFDQQYWYQDLCLSLFKWGMGYYCIEKPNRLASTVKTRQYFCRMV